MKDVTYIADGNWYLHRAYSIGSKANTTTAVFPLFLNMICRDALRNRATKYQIAFDGAKVFRYALYPNYKSTRRETKGDKTQNQIYTETLPYALQQMQELGISYVQRPDLEADDILASAAANLPGKIVLGAKDKDLYQVIRPNVSLYISDAKPEPIHIKEADVKAKFGVEPKHMVLLQTIIGDKADNILGLKGYGAKRAADICNQYGSLNAWYKAASEKEKEMLRYNKEQLALNKKLVTLVTTEDVQVFKFPKLDDPQLPKSVLAYVEFLYKSRGLF